MHGKVITYFEILTASIIRRVWLLQTAMLKKKVVNSLPGCCVWCCQFLLLVWLFSSWKRFSFLASNGTLLCKPQRVRERERHLYPSCSTYVTLGMNARRMECLVIEFHFSPFFFHHKVHQMYYYQINTTFFNWKIISVILEREIGILSCPVLCRAVLCAAMYS